MSGLDLSGIPASELAPVLDEMARLLRVVPLSSLPAAAEAYTPPCAEAVAGIPSTRGAAA
ncbi:MAG TPA: hypothetical protein VGU03_11080 [Frateuria sp.]|uniref:hypothetical protein n=1 Tax=Frateuria sp. TaxID=2211372 RepID=UPI002DF13DE6|nr:hypothetical protein [Frateuria sp.]